MFKLFGRWNFSCLVLYSFWQFIMEGRKCPSAGNSGYTWRTQQERANAALDDGEGIHTGLNTVIFCVSLIFSHLSWFLISNFIDDYIWYRHKHDKRRYNYIWIWTLYKTSFRLLIPCLTELAIILDDALNILTSKFLIKWSNFIIVLILHWQSHLSSIEMGGSRAHSYLYFSGK